MKIIKTKDNTSMNRYAASILIEKLQDNPKLRIGFATGSTPLKLYEFLVDAYLNKEISFKHAKGFNLDEYVGLDKQHPQSYYRYMFDNLYSKVNFSENNIHIPNGFATDLQAECEQFDKSISINGGIDIQILGIGTNGHIAFNEPGTTFNKRTHIVNLAESTRESNARFFSMIEEVPRQAITMGLETIIESKQIILLINGENKRAAFKRLMSGDVSEDFPASILHQHRNVTIIVDEVILS